MKLEELVESEDVRYENWYNNQHTVIQLFIDEYDLGDYMNKTLNEISNFNDVKHALSNVEDLLYDIDIDTDIYKDINIYNKPEDLGNELIRLRNELNDVIVAVMHLESTISTYNKGE